MTPADFAREVVIPTAEEFREERLSQRRAYLAAVIVYHLRDHLAEALTPSTGDPKRDRRAVETTAESVDDAVRAALPDEAFDVVRGVCNGSKHMTTRSAHVIPFTAGIDYPRPPAFYGVGVYGQSVYGDVHGGREISHDGRRFDLYRAVAATLSAFLSLYPEHFGGCTFESHEPET